jgi:hypothetical protein
MKKITTSVLIDAPPEKIWEVLTGFANYPNWNPFIQSVNGALRVGEQLVIVIKPPGGSALTFKPVIIEHKPDEVLKWKGKLWVSGLFDGTHTFRLEPSNAGQTKFIHEEEFQGLLVGIMGGGAEKDRKRLSPYERGAKTGMRKSKSMIQG